MQELLNLHTCRFRDFYMSVLHLPLYILISYLCLNLLVWNVIFPSLCLDSVLADEVIVIQTISKANLL